MNRKKNIFTFLLIVIFLPILLFKILLPIGNPVVKDFENRRFGRIEVHGFKNKAGTLFLYLYSKSGNSDVDDKLISALAENGAVVAKINIDYYLSLSQKDGDVNCYEEAGEISRLSQVLQNSLAMDDIGKFMLIGSGRKASIFSFLVHPYLSDDALGSFSTDFGWTNEVGRICKESSLKEAVALDVNAIYESKKTRYENWKYYSAVKGLSGTGNQVQSDYFVCNQSACPLIKEFSPKKDDIRAKHLPVIELLPKSIKADYFVVFLSGDGGWATIDIEIASYLQQHGIPVIGFNSLKYFWKKKDPKTIGSDFSSLISEYQTRFKTKKFILVGFSFGANIVPFIINRLPLNILNDLFYYALLSPSKSAEFEIHFTDWLSGGETTNGFSVKDEILKINNLQALCINGKREDSSLCNQALPDLIVQKTVPGEHHFDGDYLGISKILIASFEKASERLNVK